MPWTGWGTRAIAATPLHWVANVPPPSELPPPTGKAVLRLIDAAMHRARPTCVDKCGNRVRPGNADGAPKRARSSRKCAASTDTSRAGEGRRRFSPSRPDSASMGVAPPSSRRWCALCGSAMQEPMIRPVEHNDAVRDGQQAYELRGGYQQDSRQRHGAGRREWIGKRRPPRPTSATAGSVAAATRSNSKLGS